jgi:dTDP-4-dehydrorhamnose reductase
MRILVTGAGGLLGRRVMAELTARGHTPQGVPHTVLDITDCEAVSRVVGDARPELVIHCAAMTQVDRCAEQPDQALRVNGFGTHNVALACQQSGAALAYVSSNEVFDGEQAVPYLEYDATHPINPYGYSKWVGEQAVRELLPRHFVIRTSWLFAHGGDNFLHRLVRAATRGEALAVVTNEVAVPTYAEDLAEAVVRLVETGRYGIYHLVNDGSASRYQFARHLLDCAGFTGVPIMPIIAAQRPRPSQPPTYSVLRNFAAAELGIRLRPWQAAVSAFFARERIPVSAP